MRTYKGAPLPLIEVVAAVFYRDGDVLACKRAPGTSAAGKWEFPGGKVEQGETEREALEREVQEELACRVKVNDKITTTRYEYDFGFVTLSTFDCALLQGEPVLTEHIQMKWLPLQTLDTLDWAPADIPTIKKLMR